MSNFIDIKLFSHAHFLLLIDYFVILILTCDVNTLS